MVEVVNSVQNLHTLYGTGLPLGVLCTKCGNRRAIDGATLGAFDGNMRQLRSLRFRCTSCSAREVALYLFSKTSEVDEFLHGKG